MVHRDFIYLQQPHVEEFFQFGFIPLHKTVDKIRCYHMNHLLQYQMESTFFSPHSLSCTSDIKEMAYIS